MESVLALSYKCRECPQDFGDPESERDFAVWASRVSAHMWSVHKIARLQYLNDVLTPRWAHEPAPQL